MAKRKSIISKLSKFYNGLPSEIKVSLFISASYGLSEVIVEIGKIEVSNIWLAIAINILLVFLKELKPRLKRVKK